MTSQTNIADLIRDGAEEIVRRTVTGVEVSAALADFLNPLLVWPYVAGVISIPELGDGADAAYPAAVHTAATTQQGGGPVQTPAANVACVFYTARILTADELRTGYARIGAVKRLKRPPCPKGITHPMNDVPLGIIFCVESESSLEGVAEQMMALNRTTPSCEWPDMVVVLQKGTINYAVQFEGDRIKGNFLLPNTTDFPVMPMYAHVFVRGVGLHSLNRMCGFLFMHLEIFSPGVKLPENAAVEGVSSMGMTLGAYQFNLKRELVPVPDEMRMDRGAGLRNLPFRIETLKGELLSHVQFIPWQEGGAVRIIGKMPLESLLVYLGRVMRDAHIIPQENARISSVLPITRADFLKALQTFQARSNMRVKPEQPSWIVSKIADEGSSSPFMARLFMGVLMLRDRVFSDKDRDAFDKAYESALTALSDARATAGEIEQLLADHKGKVLSGEAARVSGKSIQVDGIDPGLRKHMANFVTSTGRSLKQGMQSLAKVLGLDIGFFFRDHNQYQRGLAKLALVHPELADYLTEARSWAERLNLLRNKIEHEGWILPRSGYRETGGRIEMIEPEVEGQAVSVFVKHMLDRTCCFIEEVTVYGLRTKMDPTISVSEIPLAARDPAAPERFRPALAQGGEKLWTLAYHTSMFEEV